MEGIIAYFLVEGLHERLSRRRQLQFGTWGMGLNPPPIAAGPGCLVVRGPELFDEFSKEGKKSLAFRLVFQSSDRTLSDEEVNKVMERVYAALTKQGWQIR